MAHRKTGGWMLEQERPQESHESATAYTHEGIIMQQTVQRFADLNVLTSNAK